MKIKSILIALKEPYVDIQEVNDSLLELESLVNTLDIEVLERVIQVRKFLDPRFLIGRGKLKEIQSKYKPENYNLYLIFNNEISPVQARNIENETGFKVKTRTEIILDIFSNHARTPAAKIQVELARLEYELPRIIGEGVELSRLGGGVGTRGPGEQKLEIERRYIRERIFLLKKRLKEVEKQKNTQRKKRLKNCFKIAIAGYTNSGKSFLLKRLTRADVYIENKLFATLDTTTKKLWLDESVNSQFDIVITDTVGFIKDIPHYLIESFKSTLIDTTNADLVIHLVDISDKNFQRKIKIVNDTLEEIGIPSFKILICFNKIDLLNMEEVNFLRSKFSEEVFISVKENIGIDELKKRIVECIKSQKNYPLFDPVLPNPPSPL